MLKPIVKLITLSCAISMAAQSQQSPQASTTGQEPHLLKEVVVTAQKVKIQEEGMNYTITNIQGSELSDAGTILDMMAWVPGVSLDPNENIQVFGISGTPLIYINGTKITDKTKLEALPSNMVKKIEIIRAPGAEYPTGTTAVIKITTSVPLKDLVNATIIENATRRNRFSNKLTANAFGTFGKYDLLASAGYNIGNSRQSSLATEAIYSKEGQLLRDVSTFQKDLIHTSRWNWLVGSTYHASDADELQIEYSGSRSSRHRDFISELTTTRDDIAEITNYDSRNTSVPINHTLLVSYTHDFSNSSLNFQATYNHKQTGSDEGVYLMPENSLSEINKNKTQYNMWTFQGDYSWKFLNKYNQSVGIYGGRSENRSNADYSFMGLQKVNGSVSWGEVYYSSSWNIKGYGITPGVRFRYEKQKNNSLINTTDSRFDKSYFNVVPQLSVFHRFSKKFAMNIFYKYNYSLPSFSELSPAINLTDLIYYETGNPDLKIPRRHNLALVFNLPAVSIVAEYTSVRNSIAEITTPIENTDYFLVKPVNMSGNYYLNLRAGYNLNIANKFRLYASLDLERSHTEYYYLDELQKKNKLFAMVYLNASYNIR
ncbi:MAG: outer membrane beta-barrel protein, partial [Muribaculaceae bacterium]|nr:outer membrane beta-barrel protein [Muribaculaceae bacterium]